LHEIDFGIRIGICVVVCMRKQGVHLLISLRQARLA